MLSAPPSCPAFFLLLDLNHKIICASHPVFVLCVFKCSSTLYARRSCCAHLLFFTGVMCPFLSPRTTHMTQCNTTTVVLTVAGGRGCGEAYCGTKTKSPLGGGKPSYVHTSLIEPTLKNDCVSTKKKTAFNRKMGNDIAIIKKGGMWSSDP